MLLIIVHPSLRQHTQRISTDPQLAQIGSSTVLRVVANSAGVIGTTNTTGKHRRVATAEPHIGIV
jgi:hypothetical protein